MCTRHKKALQPPHPSEPIAGQFIGNLPCRRCIPVYPLRYAVSDSPFDNIALPRLDITDYPALKGSMHYGLRPLRPACYVYLFYFQGGRMWTQHYQVTEDARFAALWWTEQDNDCTTPGLHARIDTVGATAYLPAPESDVADTVWLQVSDTLLSHCTLWKIEQDTQALRNHLSTSLKPAAGPEQAHSLPSSALQSQVFEFSAHPALSRMQQASTHWSMFAAPHPLNWSEHQHVPIQGAKVDAAMRAVLIAQPDIQPLAAVLHDPFGITSELNNLATRAVQDRARFTAENAHQLTSAQLISGYFEQNHPLEMADALTRQKALVRWPQLQLFRSSYAARLAAFDAPIEHAVDDIRAWLTRSRYLSLAITCFDLEVNDNGRDLEEFVFHCIGALVHTETGRQLLEQLVELPPEQSLYWQALAQGNKNIVDRLMKTASLSKGMFEVLDKYLEEHAATAATNALIGLLQALPAANKADVLVRRLRHVLELRFNATLIEHELSAAQYLRYAREFEGQQVLGPELIKRWGLNVDATVNPATGDVRMKFYEWVKVDETEYRVLGTSQTDRLVLPPKQAMPLEGNPFARRLEQLRGPAGHLFTGLGGVLAVMGIWQSFVAVNKSFETANLISLLGSSFALTGAGVEITAIGNALMAKYRENSTLALIAKIQGAKYGVSVFGAAGAGLFALSDAVKAINAFSSRNPERTRAYLSSAVANSALALSTWAGGTATAMTLKAGTGAIAFLGLTPAGWAIIALIALGAGIYFSLKAEDFAHTPVDIWLKHSTWGKHQRLYTHQQEMAAYYNLLYRPRLATHWEKLWGSTVGKLDISCLLPNAKSGERFAWNIRVTLDQRELIEIRAPLIHDIHYQGVDYRYQYLIRKDERIGVQREWKITMHKDAIVELEYLYHPNFEKQPLLAITQPTAPEPLIFKSANWLNDSIDESLLAPLEAPSS